jgi:lipopolysaccharide export system protein LptC
MIYRLVVGLVVVGILVGTIMLGRQQGGSGAATPVEATDTVPGYAARSAVLVETGEDGRPVYTLNAELIRQRPNDRRVQLDGVRMSYRASDGNEWKVRADSGQIRDDGSQIELYGNVHVDGLLPGSDQPAEIRTSVLTLDTKAEVVHTKAPVVLRWGGQQLEASGLEANLKTRSVKLESRVHGFFPT